METCQGSVGFQQLMTELCAAVQHLLQLLQIHLHPVTVLFKDPVHVLLHLHAQICHLIDGKDQNRSEMVRSFVDMTAEHLLLAPARCIKLILYLFYQRLLKAVYHFLVTDAALVNLFHQFLCLSADIICP